MTRRIGRYEILAEIGRGGFGHVYRALDPTVGRSVAIKTLASDGDAGMLTRFRNEAAASGRLRHPNIITIFDFGEHDGMPYIVMELLEGQDLQHVIAGSAPVTVLNKVWIMTQVAAGLQHAHTHRIIHRDVKPANIMVLPDGSVKIMDFGIALLTQSTHSRLTPRGAMIGTFRYMAPEQFRSAEPDARSDIFAYGLIFYELLSGIHPFHAADAGALMYNILSVEPVPIAELVPDCPKDLPAVIKRLLSKDPEARYQSLDDVLFDIEPSLGALRLKRSQELLDEARSAKTEGRFENAQDLVRQILELTPGDSGARRLREEIQIELRRQAVRPRVDDLIRRGREAMDAGQPAEAVERFESAIRLADVPEVQPLLEEARAGVERSKEASRLALDAENAYKAGDLAGAVQSARRALELAPAEQRAGRILAESQAALAEEERRSRLTEGLARAGRLIDIRSWQEASKLIAKIEAEYPENDEIRVLAERLRVGWAKEERDRLLAAGSATARQQVQQGDMKGALATLETLAAEYPESTDVSIMLGFVKLEIETKSRRDFVGQSIEDARAEAERREFENALNILDAALARYARDPDLQRQRRSIVAEQREFTRRSAAEDAIATASLLRSQGRFPEALPPLDSFLDAHGPDTVIAGLRDAILKDQEAARRAAELHEFIHRARDLMAKGHAEDATRLLQSPPVHLKNHPEVTQLLGAAQLQIQQRAEQKAALEQVLTEANQLRQDGALDEANRRLDGFQARFGSDPQIEEARNQLRRAAREKAARDLLDRGAALLASDPAGATALFISAPSDLRNQPEVQNLERAALQAVEELKAREAAANKALAAAGSHRSKGRLSEALPVLDGFLAEFGSHPAVASLRETILQEQEAARQSAELLELIRQAKDLMARDRAKDAVKILQAAPPYARNHPDAVQLLSAAQLQERQRAEREKAAADLVERATAMLAGDAAGAVAHLKNAPDDLRQRPEIRKLEAAALRAVEEQRARDAAAKKALALANALRFQGRLAEALPILEGFQSAYGFEPAIADLKQAIVKEEETARRAAELQDLLGQLKDLMARDRAEEAIVRLQAAPPRLRDHPDARKLLDAAQLQSKERAEREKAAQNLVAQATAKLASDPAAAAALLRAAPEALRQRAEVRNLEQVAVRAVEEQKARDLAAQKAMASAGVLRSQGRFSEALPSLDGFLASYGADPAVEGLRQIILKEREAARRAAELNDFLSQAKELLAGDRADDAIALLQTPPRDLRDHPQVAELLVSAQRHLRERAEREQAALDLLERATAMAGDPEGTAALLKAAPDYLRQRPEIQILEEAAVRALERRKARDEAAKKAVESAGTLRSQGRYGEAIPILNGFLAAYGSDTEVTGLRDIVLKEQAAARRAAELQDFLLQTHKLMAQDRIEEAIARMQAAPPRLRDHPDATLLLETARRQLLEREERDKAARDLLEQATVMLASDPSATATFVRAAPSDLRKRPEILNLERAVARAVEEQKAREAAANKAMTSASALGAEGRFAEALPALDGFLAAYGSHPAVLELRDAILKDQEGARRAEELQNLLRRSKELFSKRRTEEAIAMLQAAPPYLREHAEVISLLSAAQVELKERVARQKAAQELVERATAVLDIDPAAAATLLASAPDDLRQQPEILNLERRALRAVETRKARDAAAKKAIASARALGARGLFSEALSALDDFLNAHGADPAIAEVKETILREQEAARLAADLRELARQAKELLAQGHAEEAVLLLRNAPAKLRDHPDVEQLLGSAEAQVRQQADRRAALDKTLTDAAQSSRDEAFEEAFRCLDAFQERYGTDAEIDRARGQVKQAELDQATRDLVKRATAALALNPAGATALFESAPEDLRRQPEVQDLERAALRAAEENKARETEAKLVQEVRKLSANLEFNAALRMLDGAKNPSSGLAAVRREVVAAQQTHDREQFRKETISRVHNLAGNEEYEEALRLLKALIDREPGDEELLRLRTDVEALQTVWIADQEEREISESLGRARQMIGQKPGDAVQLLEALQHDHPDREDIEALLRNAREVLADQQRRDLLEEVDRLCQREEFEAAQARLKNAPPHEDLIEAQERIEILEQQAQDRRVAAAIESATNLRQGDPKRALQGLRELPEALRRRDEIQAAMRECQTAIVAAERLESIAGIEDLCKRGKFRKAGTLHAQAVAQFGTDAKFEELSFRITAGIPTERIPAWQIRAAAAVATAAVLAGGAWIYLHRPVPSGLMPVEIRTDPAGAAVMLGDRSCQAPNCKFDLRPGSYAVRTQLEGYQPAQQTVTVGTEKRLYSFNISLDPIVVPPPAGRPIGTLIVEAKTPGALVYVDRIAVGRTLADGRLSTTLEAAAHTIRVEKDGYQTPLEQRVRVDANHPTSIVFNLIALNAMLELRGAPSGVIVRAADRPLGSTDGTVFHAQVSPGERRLEFVAGAARRQITRVFEPGQTIVLDWTNVAPAEPVIASTPPPAAVPAPPAPAPTAPRIDPAEQAWEQARNSPDPAAVQSFIDSYPSSSHLSEARTKVDELTWTRTKQNDIQSLRTYLGRFPRGAHAREAAGLIWNSVNKNDVAALRDFLGQNPDSPHRAEAQALVEKFEAAKQALAKQQAEDKRQISEILGSLNKVLQKGKQRDLKVIWPSASKGYLDMLEHPAGSTIQLEALQAPDIAGDLATVLCNQNTQATPPRSQRVKVTLKRDGNNWIIQSIQVN